VIIDDTLAHYGTPRKSGRYPWGSGQEHRRNRDFLDNVKELEGKGWTRKQIAEAYGMSTNDLIDYKSIAKAEIKAARIIQAEGLKAKGVGNEAAAKIMGIPEPTYRTLLAPGAKAKQEQLDLAITILKDQVKVTGYLDTGAGIENRLGLKPEQLRKALRMLENEGYRIHSNVPQPQLGTGKDTKMRVLTEGDKTWADCRNNRDKIRVINERISDTGRTSLGILPPLSISPNRVMVKYAEDGGSESDGTMYIRRGAKDLDLGGARYVQARILVGKDRYLKGMAIYKDDMPPGIDIVFNTNKANTGNKLDALKKIEKDPENPFGTWISRQITKMNPKTGLEEVTSAVNLVNEEGSWTKWSRTIASQVLSKQSAKLAKEQLAKTYAQRKADYDEIMALTNPVVKKKLLEEFAQGTDAAATHLKAASLPKQAWHVILPINSLKENEVYAPNYKDGTSVALIRYPHGGTFEIPIVTVNNRNREGSSIIGKLARDAIGINAKVAERLSGADFDGDTVLVIPNNSGKIKSTPALEGLKNFDPKAKYPGYPGMKVMSKKESGTQMGIVSNLITDMTIKGASHDELVRAVRHSMVVIDANKHELNYRQSYKDNTIQALKEKYQRQPDGKAGAATLISRATSDYRGPEMKLRLQGDGGPVDRKTGQQVWVPTGKIDNRTGELYIKKGQFKKLDVVNDANTLSSGQPMEKLYADHSNKLKALANTARLDNLAIPSATPPSKSAATVYKAEVDRLRYELALAKENSPLERRAQGLAGQIVKNKVDASVDEIDAAGMRKLRGQALEEARNRVGAKKHRIEITPKQWQAIQARALPDTVLREILDNTDMDVVRSYATPKMKLLMTTSRTNQALRLIEQGNLTRQEIADKLGVSLTTLDRAIGAE
jgi:predicted DNA-binding protein (UPF0251 family)